MTFVPVLIALTVIVTGSLFIAVSVQRAFTRTARMRRELREGGPNVTVHYSVSEPAWPVPSPLPNLRKGAERLTRAVAARSRPVKQEASEAA
ncbi:hypothetical protein OKA06_14765 [Novosphingobium sp. MW5]|nr:hypothetical protein [Novosphingobium sp. MW5]